MQLRKKLAKALKFLEANPRHPGLNLERIINDPSAWSIRIDRRYRIAFEPRQYLSSGNPDWTGDIQLLRCLDQAQVPVVKIAHCRNKGNFLPLQSQGVRKGLHLF
jgi:hypothetical protein